MEIEIEKLLKEDDEELLDDIENDPLSRLTNVSMGLSDLCASILEDYMNIVNTVNDPPKSVKPFRRELMKYACKSSFEEYGAELDSYVGELSKISDDMELLSKILDPQSEDEDYPKEKGMQTKLNLDFY